MAKICVVAVSTLFILLLLLLLLAADHRSEAACVTFAGQFASRYIDIGPSAFTPVGDRFLVAYSSFTLNTSLVLLDSSYRAIANISWPQAQFEDDPTIVSIETYSTDQFECVAILSARNAGMRLIDCSGNTLREIESIKILGVKQTMRFPDNQTLLVAAEMGLLMYNVSRWELGYHPWILAPLSNMSTSGLSVDWNRQLLYVAADRGLLVFNIALFKFIDLVVNQSIDDIVCDVGGTLEHVSHFVIRTCQTVTRDVVQVYNISDDFPLMPIFTSYPLHHITRVSNDSNIFVAVTRVLSNGIGLYQIDEMSGEISQLVHIRPPHIVDGQLGPVILAAPDSPLNLNGSFLGWTVSWQDAVMEYNFSVSNGTLCPNTSTTTSGSSSASLSSSSTTSTSSSSTGGHTTTTSSSTSTSGGRGTTTTTSSTSTSGISLSLTTTTTSTSTPSTTTGTATPTPSSTPSSSPSWFKRHEKIAIAVGASVGGVIAFALIVVMILMYNRAPTGYTTIN